MGEKGAKATPMGADVAGALVDDLQTIGDVRSKNMFGGHGIFCDDSMFAIVDAEGTAFLRADESTVADFETAGAAKHGRMPYWAIPPHVLLDQHELLEWASRAAAVAAAKR